MNPETHRPTVEAALRVLDTHVETFGFDTKPLWHALTRTQREWESGTPTVEDFRYVLPEVAPDLATHFVEGRPQDLHPAHLWVGYSYSLTPGMRSILRDTYGLTPTQTVTCAAIEAFPGTVHPRAMKLVSDLHVDPRNRKHILVSAVIHNVGAFFKLAAELDEADRAERRFGFSPVTANVGRLFTLESEEKWAIEDLSGVDGLSKRVEIVKYAPGTFTVMCQKTGKQATCKWEDYLPAVAEYVTLYKTTRKKRSTTDRDAKTLEQMLASLG